MKRKLLKSIVLVLRPIIKRWFMDSDVLKDAAGVKMPAWMKFFLFAGLACYAPLFVCAAIGISRGYSVQSWVPFYMAIAGQLILLVPFGGMASLLNRKMSNYKYHSFCDYELKVHLKIAWIQFLKYGWFFLFLIIISLVGSMRMELQGRHKKLGEEFFKQRKYADAIDAYKKEIEVWYLRIGYNNQEPSCLFRVAESH